MEDQDIVSLYWAREERAVAETARKYGGYCLAIARAVLPLPQDAEEAVNDAYLAAWNAIPPHRPAVFSAFLGKLCRRAALKKWRAGRAQKRGGGETALVYEELADCVGDAGADRALEAAELARCIDRFLARQPDPVRRVFVCRYWYVDSVPSIARRFGYSESKVKSMLLRTRNKLRDYLIEEGVYDE